GGRASGRNRLAACGGEASVASDSAAPPSTPWWRSTFEADTAVRTVGRSPSPKPGRWQRRPVRPRFLPRLLLLPPLLLPPLLPPPLLLPPSPGGRWLPSREGR